MKLGFFDSGLGGLLIARSVQKSKSNIDMIYLGDTLHLPYGNRSLETIYGYSCEAMEYLFNQNCALIIVACNTVSVSALRRLQQEYLPQSSFKDRRILGVVVPTLECAKEKGFKRLGLMATNFTISSHVYNEELKKIDPSTEIYSISTPLLVPLIENDGMRWIKPILEDYLAPLLEKKIECLILGCTHYILLKEMISQIVGPDITIISQDEIIPPKLDDYLNRHPEIHKKLSKNGDTIYQVSDITESYVKAAQHICGFPITITQTDISMLGN